MARELSFGLHNLSKNCNETLILATLLQNKKHGYQIALELEDRSEGFFKFNHGTLYPILHKLEQDALIKGEWQLEGPKRKRKYYSITARGKKYLSAQAGEWEKFMNYFNDIAGEIPK